MHFISWKLINYWLSYAIFQKCLQILWNPLQIFSTELQNSLRYSAGQGLITPCIICTLYLTTKFILQQHYIAKVLFHYTCCGAGRGVCQGVVDNGWYRTL